MRIVHKQRWNNLPLTTHSAEMSVSDVISKTETVAKVNSKISFFSVAGEIAGAPGKKRRMRSTVTNWSDSHLNCDTCRCMNLLSRAIINFFFESWSLMRKMHNENGKAFISDIWGSVCVCVCAFKWLVACTLLVISNRDVRAALKAPTTPCPCSRRTH